MDSTRKAPSRHMFLLEGSRVLTPSTRKLYPYSSGANGPMVTVQSPVSPFIMGSDCINGIQLPVRRTSSALGARIRKVTLLSWSISGEMMGLRWNCAKAKPTVNVKAKSSVTRKAGVFRTSFIFIFFDYSMENSRCDLAFELADKSVCYNSLASPVKCIQIIVTIRDNRLRNPPLRKETLAKWLN